MTDKSVELILKEFHKLQGVSAHLWEAIVKQQVYSGIMSAISSGVVSLILLFLLYYLIKLGIAAWNDEESDDEETTNNIATLLGIGIGILVVFTVSTDILGSSILKIVNPEYYAAMEILEKFRPVK